MKESRRTHTIRRAYERFGVRLSNFEYDRLCRRVLNGQGILLEKISNRRWIVAVPFFQEMWIVCYHSSLGEIETVYPASKAKKYNARQGRLLQMGKMLNRGKAKEAAKLWRRQSESIARVHSRKEREASVLAAIERQCKMKAE